jgi:hypothetical protein
VLGEHRHRGAAWVAGRPGDRYAVRLSNRSGARVLVVLSVDGINAISGQTAGASQTGYVLGPWQSADITGWRKSDDEAAAFYFTALPDSYAARTDRPANVGVIGAAVFRERVPEPPPPVPFEPMIGGARSRADGAAEQAADDSARRSAPAPASGAAAERDASSSSSDQAAARRESRKLGTGHGEREWAPINRTAFERATPHPAEIVQVRYDSHANLVAAGVIAPPPAPWGGWGEPRAFPSAHGFAPDPWR